MRTSGLESLTVTRRRNENVWSREFDGDEKAQ